LVYILQLHNLDIQNEQIESLRADNARQQRELEEMRVMVEELKQQIQSERQD